MTSSQLVREAMDRAAAGRRLDAEQGLALLEHAPLHDLAELAHAARLRNSISWGPDRRSMVSYVVDRNINYTDICSCGCAFCAFHKVVGDPAGSVLSREELFAKIAETLDLGGHQVLMQGGHHPDLGLEWFEELFRAIKDRYPIHLHALSPPEVVYLARREGLTTGEVLDRLIAAGLDSIPGGGAEILVDRVRREVAPAKCSTAEWLEVMGLAHERGLHTTATMMFGHVETPAERIAHLLAVRETQERSLQLGRGRFTAFIPWTFQPGGTKLAERTPIRKLGSLAYLRMLAVSRLMLDNVDHIQVSWVTQGAHVAQLGLFFGADDFGSTMLEENVVAAAGVRFRMSEADVRRVIAGAGFTPRRRRQDYRLLPEEQAA